MLSLERLTIHSLSMHLKTDPPEALRTSPGRMVLYRTSAPGFVHIVGPPTHQPHSKIISISIRECLSACLIIHLYGAEVDVVVSRLRQDLPDLRNKVGSLFCYPVPGGTEKRQWPTMCVCGCDILSSTHTIHHYSWDEFSNTRRGRNDDSGWPPIRRG
jgi:hypothetical protein